MWNPIPSSSTASSSDNKQNIKEVVDVNDCKCSSSADQLNQQQKHNSKQNQPTSTFGDQLTGSSNIHQNKQETNIEDDNKFSNLAEETTDSGFISGPQATSSELLESVGVSGEIKQLNLPESSSEPQLQNKAQQKKNIENLDSGIIEEEENYEESDLDQPKKQTVASTVEPNMILPHSVESGISEWFCQLSLQNNLNAANESNSRTNPSVLVSPANAWEKYYQQDDDGDTSLHLACISGFVDVVAALIRMAPNPCLFNIKNDAAQTALHLATLTAQPKIIRMLLIAGAEPTVRDRHGNTALHLACVSGEEQCVRALTIPISASEVNEAHRQYGHRANDKSYLKYAKLPSDLEIRNYDGERCVHLAAQAGFINILRILVLYGADINAREGKAGRTPLHIAIECCNEDLANYLLDDCQKLNLETATYSGLTAYQVAFIHNKSEMQNILEKRGAEPLMPPDSDYDSSDIETDFDDSKLYDRFGDPGYFVGYKGGNAMTVA